MPEPMTASQIFRANNDFSPGMSEIKLGDRLAGIGQNPSGGADYYVDGNKSNDLGDGLSWATAKKLLASAVTLANAYEALSANRAWAKRQRIHCTGDTLAEDLTILPHKCDVIGYGTHDGNPICTITGDHTIGAGSYFATRFINMRFLHKNAAGDIFTIPTTTSGIQFLGCEFDAHQATKAGGAILATAVNSLKIVGCSFIGAFSDAVIEIKAGAGNNMLIADNTIQGGQAGIEINSSYTTAQWASYILRNVIRTVGICIDDNSDKLVISDNRGVTDANKGTSLAGAVDGSTILSLNNFFTCADEVNVRWPAEGSI